MTPTCGVCNVELRSAGRGPTPKWCKKHRNTRAARPQKRLADYGRFEREKTPCESCGRPCGKTSKRCRRCFHEACEVKRERIVKLWATGLTMGEIAREIGTTKGSVSVQINTMRAKGYDLPYRHKMVNGVRVG